MATEGKKRLPRRSARRALPPPSTATKREAQGLIEQTPKKRKAPSGPLKLKESALPPQPGLNLREQVKQECAHLLICEESLVANKAIGVYAQVATANKTWEERFLDFLVFSKGYGHGHVPKECTDNPALGRWVGKMRAYKKKKNKNLTDSRLRRLDAAGFIWDAKKDPDFYTIQGNNEKAADVWDANYTELLNYKKEHGDCMVPKIFKPNPKLARWVATQRKNYKAKQEGRHHSLTDEREKDLLCIGFVFILRTKEILRDTTLKLYEDRWDSYIERLIAFKKKHGHCAVPRRWKEDTKLASWVMRQRFQRRRKEMGEHSYLTDERVEQLRDIGFVFTINNRRDYPLKGSRTRTIEVSDDNEESDDEEEKEYDEDADVEKDGDSELISSEDDHNDDDETEIEDSEGEGNSKEEGGQTAAINSDSNDDSLTTLANVAAMLVEEV